MAEAMTAARYPIQLEVDYPERQSRWKTLVRLLLIIPLVIFYYLLNNSIALAIWAAILVRGRMPRWLFDFQVAFNRWGVRFSCYVLLLTDQYPPFEGDYPIRYDVQYPERLSRWRLVIWKFITSVPHFIVLSILIFTLIAVVPIGWFAILIVGRFPRGLHQYVAGILRWGARLGAYFYSLTDEFPPFSLAADAGPGGRDSYVISSVMGVLATGGVIAGIVTLGIFARAEAVTTEVSYQRLLAGEVSSAETRVTVDSVSVELGIGADPADALVPFLAAQPGYRFVLLDLGIENDSSRDLPIRKSNFRLKDANGDGHDAFLVIVSGRIPPLGLREDGFAVADLIFEVPQGVQPSELRYRPARLGADTVVYELR